MQADAFYRQIALQAKGKGVACSVVAIKGSKCRMEILGMLAEESGGEVDIVDPADVSARRTCTWCYALLTSSGAHRWRRTLPPFSRTRHVWRVHACLT